MKKAKRANLKDLRAVRAQTYVEVPELPDLHLETEGYTIPGHERCNALGLTLGDCRQRRWPGSIYCYYHLKLSAELLEPTAPVYPVWPLPLRRWQLPVQVEEKSRNPWLADRAS